MAIDATAGIGSTIIMKRTARNADHSVLVENAASIVSAVVIKCTVNDADVTGVVVDGRAH